MLPTRARRLRFPLRLRGSLLEVDIEEEVVTYRVRSGDPDLIYPGEVIVLPPVTQA